MNKQCKRLFIVASASIVIAGVVSILFLLDPTFAPDFYRITSMVIVVTWSFFFIPALLFTINYLAARIGSQPYEQTFRKGLLAGVFLGLGGMAILFIIVSPVTGIWWYVQTIKAAAYEDKGKPKPKNGDDNQDIFNI